MLSVRLRGSPHPDPLSLLLLDEFETENLFINCQSEGLKILKVESGLEHTKTPGTKTTCLHYDQSLPLSPIISNKRHILPFDNLQYVSPP